MRRYQPNKPTQLPMGPCRPHSQRAGSGGLLPIGKPKEELHHASWSIIHLDDPADLVQRYSIDAFSVLDTVFAPTKYTTTPLSVTRELHILKDGRCMVY